MARIKEKLIPGVLTFFTLYIIFTQFSVIYDLQNVTTSLIGVFLVVAIAVLVPYKSLRVLLYAIATVITLYMMFPLRQGFTFSWITAYIDRLRSITQTVLQGNIDYLPPEPAVTLVLIFSIMIVELVVEYKQIVASYVAVIIYLLFVVVYNDLNLPREIIILVCMGLLQKSYVSNYSLLAKTSGKLQYLLIVLGITALGFTAVSIPRNSIERVLYDSSINFRSLLNKWGVYEYIEQGGGSIPRRTGFSDNDSFLGGPLIDNNKVIFRSKQTKPHYWRVETKNEYIGTGWKSSYDYSTNQYTRKINNRYLAVDYPDNTHPSKDWERIQTNYFHGQSYFPVPYGDLKINTLSSNDGYRHNTLTDRFEFLFGVDDAVIEIEYRDLDYTIEDLRHINTKDPSKDINYFQLPPNFPNRVKELAREIVKDKDTQIDKVLAIEDYLSKTSGLKYSKTNAEMPYEGMDYVEHFLFESKTGYCDNFSTAMVTMLRSVNVPARWAKGFAPGERTTINGEVNYEVRNSDAHSWVEVYFDGYGWLPFEPTPSFTGSTHTEIPKPKPNPTTPNPSNPNTSNPNNPTTPNTPNIDKPNTPNIDKPNTDDSKILDNLLNIMPLIGIAAGLLFMGIIWFFRLRIGTYLILRLSKNPLQRIYPLLLKRAHNVLPRNQEEPLIEYAHRLESKHKGLKTSFIQLTQLYEDLIYGKKEVPFLRIKETSITVSKYLGKNLRYLRKF